MNTDFDISLNKIPPRNIEAEQSILGGILLDNGALNIAAPVLNPEDFYTEAHRIIFKTMLEMTEKAWPIDSVSLVDALQKGGQLEKIGGYSYVSTLMDSTPSAANIGFYCRIVKDKAIARALIGEGTKLCEKAYSSNGDGTEQVIYEALRSIMDIAAQGKAANDFADPRELCKRTFSVLEERAQNKGSLIGISTGFKELDSWTSGLQRSDLIIIAGRPGMGKTSLAMNIAESIALNKIPVAVFSLEMPDESLMIRVFSSQVGIDSRQLRRGFVQDNDWPRIVHVTDQISRTPLYIDDSPNLSTLDLKLKAQRLKINKGLGLVIVDYLQLMRSSRKVDNREQEIAEISRSLKALAKELSIPVIAVSQLNRRVDGRDDKRPGLSDLRESGAIEQDADLILFLYRDEFYNENSAEKGIAEVIIGKQRSGPTGKLKLAYNEKCTKFGNLNE